MMRELIGETNVIMTRRRRTQLRSKCPSIRLPDVTRGNTFERQVEQLYTTALPDAWLALWNEDCALAPKDRVPMAKVLFHLAAKCSDCLFALARIRPSEARLVLFSIDQGTRFTDGFMPGSDKASNEAMREGANVGIRTGFSFLSIAMGEELVRVVPDEAIPEFVEGEWKIGHRIQLFMHNWNEPDPVFCHYLSAENRRNGWRDNWSMFLMWMHQQMIFRAGV